ncbi:MAG: PEP-CTERM sorting domain-containing protein [Phycisphaerae bacterium]|nr:PEP-CTERM sorting domain-containing protein [Phycisphaerae bacterium]
MMKMRIKGSGAVVVAAVAAMLFMSLPSTALGITFEFEDEAYDTIAELETAGWVFQNVSKFYRTHYYRGVYTNVRQLILGDPTGTQPIATYDFGSLATGHVDLDVFVGSSITNGRVQILDSADNVLSDIVVNPSTFSVNAATGGIGGTAASNNMINYNSSTSGYSLFSWDWTSVDGTNRDFVWSWTNNEDAGSLLYEDLNNSATFHGTGTPQKLRLINGNYSSVQQRMGTAKITVTPEPATMALLGIGGIGVLIRRRRRRA